APEALGDRLGEHRLAGARHVLDQQMALAQERDEREADLIVLADDDPLDVGDDSVAGLLDGWHSGSPQRSNASSDADPPSDVVTGWYVGTAHMVPTILWRRNRAKGSRKSRLSRGAGCWRPPTAS